MVAGVRGVTAVVAPGWEELRILDLQLPDHPVEVLPHFRPPHVWCHRRLPRRLPVLVPGQYNSGQMAPSAVRCRPAPKERTGDQVLTGTPSHAPPWDCLPGSSKPRRPASTRTTSALGAGGDLAAAPAPGGDAGTELERWGIGGRDAAGFPEVAAGGGAGAAGPGHGRAGVDGQRRRAAAAAAPADGAFCRRPGERVGRGRLGLLSAVDYSGPLIAWRGAVIRRRRGRRLAAGYDNNPWWVGRSTGCAAMAAQLRVLGTGRGGRSMRGQQGAGRQERHRVLGWRPPAGRD